MTTHRMLNRRTLITALGVGAAGISLGTAFAASAAENNNETGFRYFTGKGLSAAQAAGIIGNFIQESQRGDGVMHPDRTQDGGGPGRGIAQWTAGQRWATLVSYANQQGRDPWSLSLQLDFVWHELRGTHVSAYNALVACGDVRSATLAFSKYYEGCGICHNDRRVAFAQQVYARYGSGGGGGGGGGGDTHLPLLEKGSTGSAVTTLQYLLRHNGQSLAVDGIFGPGTHASVASYQRGHGLDPDGVVGPLTWNKILPIVESGNEGYHVRALQFELREAGHGIELDGVFGPATGGALAAYQKANGLVVDQVAGPMTWRALID